LETQSNYLLSLSSLELTPKFHFQNDFAIVNYCILAPLINKTLMLSNLHFHFKLNKLLEIKG